MLRFASLAFVAATATACLDQPQQIEVTGGVELAPACGAGADRIGVDLFSGTDDQQITLHCYDDGSFSLSVLGYDTATLTVDAMGCGTVDQSAVELGQHVLPLDTSSGFVDVGWVELPAVDCL